MDIIPRILTEDMVSAMTNYHLELLTKCTTDRVMDFVLRYLESPDADPTVKQRLSIAYDYIIKRNEYLNSEETKQKSELLLNTTYDSVSVALTVKQLRDIQEAIDYITKSEYAVPYVSTVGSSELAELRQELKEYVKDHDNYQLKVLLNNLQKYGDLFRDGRDSQNKGTVVKKVVRNMTTYEIISRGIDFIIGIKESGKTYQSWRFL